MAQAMSIAAAPKSLTTGKLGLGHLGFEELVRRNLELERELQERREREEKMMAELEKTKEKLQFVEEAEERLCSELGELEAEAVTQARIYQRRIKELVDRLAGAAKIGR